MDAQPSTPRDDPKIAVRALRKHYGEVEALCGIDFSVGSGEVVGFLGPNGAGKTTTMKILTCFLTATAGSAEIAGFDVHDAPDEVRRRIGYLPESVPLYDDMLVWDYLRFVAQMRGVTRDDEQERVEWAAEQTGLLATLSRPISELSKGYRQRVGIAQAIVHEPEVVILDEPTTGLDPNQILEVRALIREIGASRTVLFSTHIMQEVEAVCDRVLMLHHGHLIVDAPIAELRARGPLEELFRAKTSSAALTQYPREEE